jgi:riboflavin kinase/FMN adenylyltransferase
MSAGAAPSLASAIALGNFDGVHTGHRRILQALRERAGRDGLRPLALTFDPHPRHFFAPDSRAALLTSPREKAALIAGLGVELVTLAFDAKLAALSAEEFFARVLRDALGGAVFLLGPDHRFGRGALGDAALLRALAHADAVLDVPPVSENGEIVSSSAIRRRLEGGTADDIEAATRMLGRPYTLGGTVVRGRERGRLLGFPTANLSPEDSRKIFPAFGVYGGYARFMQNGSPERRPAVANIGLRPTFAEPEPSVEVHIPDWSGDLYGNFVEFELVAPLRPEMKFDSVDALKAQISHDVQEWKSRLQEGF